MGAELRSEGRAAAAAAQAAGQAVLAGGEARRAAAEAGHALGDQDNRPAGGLRHSNCRTCVLHPPRPSQFTAQSTMDGGPPALLALSSGARAQPREVEPGHSLRPTWRGAPAPPPGRLTGRPRPGHTARTATTPTATAGGSCSSRSSTRALICALRGCWMPRAGRSRRPRGLRG